MMDGISEVCACMYVCMHTYDPAYMHTLWLEPWVGDAEHSEARADWPPMAT